MPGPLDLLGQGLGLAGRGLGAVAQGGGRLLEGAAGAGGRLLEGMGQAVKPVPQQGPADLSDLPGAQRALLGILSAVAQAGGQKSPIEQLMARRQAEADRRRQALVENLAVLDKMRGFLDTVPLEQRGQTASRLRGSFESEFGGAGSGELFDAVLGDPAHAPGLIGQLGEDPEVAQYLGRADANMAGLRALASSEGVRARAAERQDLANLPTIQDKLGRMLSSQAPTLRGAIERAQKDGKLSLEEVRALNDMAGEGPEGGKLSAAELATLERRQGDIAARVPGFTTTEEFASSRKRAAELEDFKQKEDIQQKNRLALEFERAKKTGKAPSTATFGQVLDARNAYQRHSKAAFTVIDSAKKIERAISKGGGAADIATLYGFIKNLDPDSAVREGEISLTQQGISKLHRLQLLGQQISEDRTLTDDQRSEILELAREAASEVSRLQAEYEANTRSLAQSYGVSPEHIMTRSVGAQVNGDAEAPTAGERKRPTPEQARQILEQRRRSKGAQ